MANLRGDRPRSLAQITSSFAFYCLHVAHIGFGACVVFDQKIHLFDSRSTFFKTRATKSRHNEFIQPGEQPAEFGDRPDRVTPQSSSLRQFLYYFGGHELEIYGCTRGRKVGFLFWLEQEALAKGNRQTTTNTGTFIIVIVIINIVNTVASRAFGKSAGLLR
jgi:hypothetical protein